MRDNMSRSASWVHSAIASRVRAPASTAVWASVSTVARACRTPLGSRGSGTCANTSISGRRDSPAVGEDDMAAGDFRDGRVWKLDRYGASPAAPAATHVTSVTHVTAGQLHSAPTLPTPWVAKPGTPGAWIRHWRVMALDGVMTVSYTHLRAHETDSYLVCR